MVNGAEKLEKGGGERSGGMRKVSGGIKWGGRDKIGIILCIG